MWDELKPRLKRISDIDAEVSFNVQLASHTTIRVGGAARAYAACRRRDGVVAVLQLAREFGVPWIVLGRGANVLVPDEGIDAIILSLEGDLATVEQYGARVRAGGGASLAQVVRASIDAGLAGVECLGGIPSTVGGALAMNAGAFGQEILDVLSWAETVEEDGSVKRYERWEVESGYRWSVLGKRRIVIRAELLLRAEAPEALRERVQQARDRRLNALPSEPSAGSVFRNPPGDHAGRLLELAGCKGLRRGNAEVSEKHANVIVNRGGATAADVRALVAEMARRVRDQFAIQLELELKVVSTSGAAISDPEAPLA